MAIDLPGVGFSRGDGLRKVEKPRRPLNMASTKIPTPQVWLFSGLDLSIPKQVRKAWSHVELQVPLKVSWRFARNRFTKLCAWGHEAITRPWLLMALGDSGHSHDHLPSQIQGNSPIHSSATSFWLVMVKSSSWARSSISTQQPHFCMVFGPSKLGLSQHKPSQAQTKCHSGESPL